MGSAWPECVRGWPEQGDHLPACEAKGTEPAEPSLGRAVHFQAAWFENKVSPKNPYFKS